MRAIAEVSTAVAKGDLTRSITVEAQGEVAALKDNINQMIGNLKDTTHKNQEQDWLKTNLAKFSGMMQGQRSIVVGRAAHRLGAHAAGRRAARRLLHDGAPKTEPSLHLIATYGFGGRKNLASSYKLKESLIGQCAFERKRILLDRRARRLHPHRDGHGRGARRARVVVLPVLFEGEIKAVIELASFRPFTPNHLTFLDQLMASIGVILNMISSSMRTEELLQQLKKSNAELEAQAAELNEKAKLLEVKNQEVELASRSLEEKAEQLQLISKYKSEFLANMSHELRTPLNSLLILSKTLAENRDGNLTDEQVKFAETVYTLGQRPAAAHQRDPRPVQGRGGQDAHRPAHVPARRGPRVPRADLPPRGRAEGAVVRSSTWTRGLPATMFTDPTRLQQILKNLLSNAFKFTAKGGVTMTVDSAPDEPELDPSSPSRTPGIGIPLDKHKLIFEAFQQADGTTSRKLRRHRPGATISREMARLLGGAIEVRSAPGQGSTFTLRLPASYAGAEAVARDESRAHETAPEPSVPPLPEDADFSGKKVLLVDDDGRNVFAISSVLKDRGMEVLHAENGKVALELLQRHGDVDCRPHGYDDARDGRTRRDAARSAGIARFERLPIISLTAKAMKGDREKALLAGASEYVTKPVDPERLLAILHAWLERARAPRDVS